MHYILLEFFITSMCSYRKTGTYKVIPMHCKVPTMSDQDKTIISATELIEYLRETAPRVETDKSRHAKAITDLTSIITDSPSQRVRLRRSLRVANRITTITPAPRGAGGATTSTNLTSLRVVQATQYVHQRTNRNNNPFPPPPVPSTISTPTAYHAFYQTPCNTAFICQKALYNLVGKNNVPCYGALHPAVLTRCGYL